MRNGITLTLFAVTFGIAQRACKSNLMRGVKLGKIVLKSGKRSLDSHLLSPNPHLVAEIGNSSLSLKKTAKLLTFPPLPFIFII